MFKKMYEIEIFDDQHQPTYIYIECDENIEIDLNLTEKVTHITTIENECGIDPDLIVSRRK